MNHRIDFVDEGPMPTSTTSIDHGHADASLNRTERLGREDLKVWLINLDRATERREQMTERLNHLGVPFERFAAIDGAQQSHEFTQRIELERYERQMGQRILPGKIGCYFSHLSVWQELADSDASVGMILEDDLVFHDNFLETLELALASADSWDVLKLCATRAKMPVTQGMVGDLRLNAYIGRFTGNACYLVKREVARRLVPKLGRMELAFEYEILRYFRHDIRIYGLEPFPCHVEDHGQSQITGRGHSKLKKLQGLKRMPYLLGKVGNYGRRIGYLAKKGRLRNRTHQLIERDRIS